MRYTLKAAYGMEFLIRRNIPELFKNLPQPRAKGQPWTKPMPKRFLNRTYIYYIYVHIEKFISSMHDTVQHRHQHSRHLTHCYLIKIG